MSWRALQKSTSCSWLERTGKPTFINSKECNKKGFFVVSFDAPAHGGSSSYTTNVPEFVEAINFLNTTKGPLIMRLDTLLAEPQYLIIAENIEGLKKSLSLELKVSFQHILQSS